MEGLPESAKPVVVLQLSSPVEEATISQIFDPLNSDPPPEGTLATFKGVETSVATLSVTVSDAEIPLGSSSPHEVAPLCALDAMDVKDQYVTELPVAIVPNSGSTTSQVMEDSEKGDVAEVGAAEIVEVDGEKEIGTDAEAEAEVVQPICTLTLRITYKPSPKDQREELYELLNRTSQRKATALDNLRKISLAMTKGGDGNHPSTESSNAHSTRSGAVKAGFLNKKKKEPTRLQSLYDTTVGPNSFLMKGVGALIAARNYIVFFGAVTFFHYQGQRGATS